MSSIATAQKSGVKLISTNGYSNCIELSNSTTRVVLEPNCGGRVLYYELNGKNILYIDPRQDGWTWDGDEENDFPYYGGPCGGRFDIGPEKGTPKRPLLFLGKWEAEIIGPRAARLISQKDSNTGIQLFRYFKLNEENSELICIQTMKNISDKIQKYYHWSRTFAVGNGTCLVPVSEQSRFPSKYMLYTDDEKLDFDPVPEDAIKLKNNILEISSIPSKPKIAIDTDQDWIAYLSRNGLLFIKTFPIYPNRAYGDLAGHQISVWYYKDKVCELEPTSPFEVIVPGEEYSFTEIWNLIEYKYVESNDINHSEILNFVGKTRRSSEFIK